jgi:transcriptional regulator with XRE-family HTH domain
MVGMGTRVKSRLKEPQRRRHFIKEWRKARGLTQEQLAERIGVAVSTISQLETMKQGYSQPTLEAIADALNCEPADLLMRKPPSKNSDDPSDGIWSIWETLDPPAKIQAVKILETFKKTGTEH